MAHLGEAGLRVLAELESIARPTASAPADRLERAELVERVRSQTDRRRVGRTSTAAGRRLLQTCARRTGWQAQRLERLSPAERAASESGLQPLARLIAAPAN